MAWWIISAIRIRSLTEFIVPVAANHSWSTIAAIDNNTCLTHIVEDVPTARKTDLTRLVQREDLEWVFENITRFASLLKNPKFRLAVEALSTYHFQSSKRLMVAHLWSGIEALFEIQSELRFRLATIIASILEPRGDKRVDLYRKTKKLYDVRSKAVHGSVIDNSKLLTHIQDTRQLLSLIICKFTELNHVPNEEELESYIFS